MCSLKTFLFAILFAGALIAPANSSDLIYPSEYGGDSQEFKDLTWNRYTTENFVIVSIDDKQGKWLSENIEKIKSWCLVRWGFPDLKFSKECRIFVVPNKILFKKLFNIEQSKYEIREELTVIWLVLDEKPTIVIPSLITNIALYEFDTKYQVSTPLWFKNGSSQLNSNVLTIHKNIEKFAESFKRDDPIFTCENIFIMTEESYKSEDNKLLFDQQSMILCLMLRKEFGEAKLQGFLRIINNNNIQDVLRVVYGFDGYEHFDKQYYLFMKELSEDIVENKTPNSYLEIKPVR